MSFVFNLLAGVWGKIAAVGAVVLAVLTFGALKKREGRIEKEASDREAISEAENSKRERDRAIRAAPAGTGRKRVRNQRDKLRKSVRSNGPNHPE